MFVDSLLESRSRVLKKKKTFISIVFGFSLPLNISLEPASCFFESESVVVFCTCVLCCDSLREAQAVLLKKGLSRGGNGDKMAALLMKHVEKEKKKLLPSTTAFPPASSNSSLSPAPSSSLKAHVRTFHTQKGQYTVHLMPPGQFFCTTRMQQKVLHKN